MARFHAVLAIAFLIPSLAAQAQVRTVRGDVRDSAGNPLDHVDVIALLEGRVAQTNADGSFSLDGIALGAQRFLFRRVGYNRVEMTVVIGPAADIIRARLTPVGMTLDPVVVSGRRTGLFGTVGDTSYKAIAGVEILVVGGGKTVTDSAGRFTLPRVRAGTYLMRIRKKGYSPEQRSLTIPRGESLELSVLLEPVRPGLTARQVAAASGYNARLEWALAESDSRQIRCRGGTSVLVTREDLAEQGQGTLAEALPRTRSASAKGYGRMELQRYRVIVDGVDNPGPPGGGIPLDDFFPADIGAWPLTGIAAADVEAVEIYKGYPSFGRTTSRQSSFGRLTRRTVGGFGCPQATIWIWLR